MNGVQKGGVGNPSQTVINSDEVRNRSIPDLLARDSDIRELRQLYAEAIGCLESGKCFAEDLIGLEGFIGYCIGRPVDICKGLCIPDRGELGRYEYSMCINSITQVLLGSGLMSEILAQCDEPDVRYKWQAFDCQEAGEVDVEAEDQL